MHLLFLAHWFFTDLRCSMCYYFLFLLSPYCINRDAETMSLADNSCRLLLKMGVVRREFAGLENKNDELKAKT